jgi:2-keto-4-pentenoate hydratase/2-oxohepta-3-ene-1,7-dioic acid hydratase in catechol pathway
MRWSRFRYKERVSFGIVEAEKIIEVSGNPFEKYIKTDNHFCLNEVELLPPVIPKTIYCAGQNYLDHIVKSAKRKGLDPIIPQKPDFNYRAVNSLIGHEANILIPKDAGEPLHFEAELVAVIGKKAKHVPKGEAASYIFGYTIGNDVSARNWQKTDRTHWRAKNTDTFKPMGPWIETDVDLNKMKTIVRVNGNILIEHQTCNFLFDVATCISFMTRYVTLFPGDVIWMGSEGESPNLKPGDRIEIEITGIGVLRNTFVAEK